MAPMKIHSRIASILILLSLLGNTTTLLARQEPAQPAEPAQRFADALRMAGEGEFDSAIAELEALRELPDSPPAVSGILGALYVELGEMERGYELLQPIADSDATNPAVLYNAGRAAVALGQIEQAFGYLSRSVEMEPGSPASRELGLLLGGMGQFGEGYRYLRPWVLQNPDDTRALMAAAIGAVELARVTEAEELLGELDAEDPGVKLLWGQLLVAKGDPWGAIGYLKPMLDTAPDAIQGDIRYTLAGAYMTVGESAGAAEVLDGREGGKPLIALRLAQALYQAGEVEKAIGVLEPFAAPMLDPKTLEQVDPNLAANLVVDYGGLLNNSGRAEEALPFLQLGTELAPDVKRGWQALGQALAATGSREAAQAALERFKELSELEEQSSAESPASSSDPAMQALRDAMQMAAEGQTDQALQRLQSEIELTPNDPRPRLLAAQILLQDDRPEEALQAALSVSEVAPDDPDSLYMVGASRMALEQMGPAEEALRRVLELAPEHTPAMNDLAVLLMTSGRSEEARTLLERVLELRPDDPVAKLNLDRLNAG